MEANLYHITLWNLLSFFIFLGLLEGLNLFFAAEHVPSNEIIAASAVFCFFYVLLFASTWKLLSPRRTDRVIGGAWAVLAVALVIWCSYPMIYDWLPRLGVHFHQADMAFDLLEFRERMLRGLIFVWLFSAGAASVYRYMASRFMIRQANARRDAYKVEVDRMQVRLETRHFSPHTIENVVAITMGKMTTDNKKEYLEALMVLAEVLHYALHMQDEEATVTFAEEWTQVENMLALGRVCHGDKALLLHRPKLLPTVQLPMGILVMPVENALKYATITADKAILLDLQAYEGQWRFTVTNSFREIKRQAIRSGKTGFVLLRRKIELGDWPIAIERKEQGNTFTVSIVGKFE